MITTWKKELLLLFLIFYLSLSIDIEDSEISYLENYGYIETDNAAAPLRTDDFYSEKIREFQEMLALPLTGVMDTATKDMMKAPRCGLRDKDKRRGKRDRRRVMRKWPKKALTYWVKNAPISDNHYDEVRKEIKKAFKAWEDVAGLTFEEKESSNGMDVDIVLSFEPREHGDDIPFEANDMAHAFFPSEGDVHFSNDRNFRVEPGFYEEINLLHVAMHELGHSFGLPHMSKTDSVMYPTITYSPARLSDDDIAAIQALYGKKTSHTDRREEDSERPDPCDGRRIDAAVTIGREVYLFKNKWFWTFRGGRLHTRPRLVSSYWPELMGNVDSVLSYDGYQYFFVGDDVYIYEDRALWGTRKLTVYGIPSEVKKIRVAFAWNNGESTKFYLWADNTEYTYDPVLNTTETEPISWMLDRVTANLVVHGDNYIFTDRGVHLGNTTTFTYEEPIPFSRLFHCEETRSSHPKPTTTTTISTTTKAPWTQKLIVLRDPEAMVRYYPSSEMFSKSANPKWFRNHIVTEISHRLYSRIGLLLCNSDEVACACDEKYNCSVILPAIHGGYSFEVYVVCGEEGRISLQREISYSGNCSIHAQYPADVIAQNVHYISCGKCANQIKLDTSPPLGSCLPSLEDHEKSVLSRGCAANQHKVANKLQVDNAIAKVRTFEDTERISCRYLEGEIFYFMKRSPNSSKASLSFTLTHGCLKTEDGNFYTIEGQFGIFHRCHANGKCTLLVQLLSEDGKITAVHGGKTYTEEGQKKADDTNKPFNDTDAYLHGIVSITDGSCPQRICPKYVG